MGKKKWRESDWIADFMLEAFKKLGAEFYDEDIRCGFVSIFCIRILGERVQLAVREHFDRWANSVDYEFESATAENADTTAQAILITALREYRNGNHSTDWGAGVELNLRKAKRQLKTQSWSEIIDEIEVTAKKKRRKK